jgi:hypothetical protein
MNQRWSDTWGKTLLMEAYVVSIHGDTNHNILLQVQKQGNILNLILWNVLILCLPLINLILQPLRERVQKQYIDIPF